MYYEQPLKKELSSFVECVIQNKPPLVSGEIARYAMVVAFKICKEIWKK